MLGTVFGTTADRLRGIREPALLVCHPVLVRQVTVLGSCGAFPEPGRACSGFAVDWDGYRLVLDLGYATLPRLLAHWPDGVLDGVAITHEHPDHCIDLHLSLIQI